MKPNNPDDRKWGEDDRPVEEVLRETAELLQHVKEEPSIESHALIALWTNVLSHLGVFIIMSLYTPQKFSPEVQGKVSEARQNAQQAFEELPDSSKNILKQKLDSESLDTLKKILE